MLRALLYLRLTSLKNQIISRAKRLRQLKYLLGALVGGAYVYFLFFRNFGGASGSRGAARTAATQTLAALPSSEALAQTLPLIAAVSALLLLALTGCGQKGPLFLPSGQAVPVTVVPAPNTTAPVPQAPAASKAPASP